MPVKRLGNGEWYSTFAGRSYDSREAAEHYDKRLRPVPDPTRDSVLDKLSPLELAVLKDEIREESAKIMGDGKASWDEIQTEFVESTPEYLPTQENGDRLISALVGRGTLTANGVFLGTVRDLQEVFYDLAEVGGLQLREGAKKPKRPFNEATAYGMQIHELGQRVREQFSETEER